MRRTVALPFPTQKQQDLFWRKVRKAVPTECWLWEGRCDREGYGQLLRVIDGKNVHFGAHQYSWLIAAGSIPTHGEILHSCDVRNCVNPAHLSHGTHQENQRDMVAKGRCNPQRGEQRSCAKLNEAAVRAIRQRRARGENSYDLADEYGVSQALISDVALRKAWTHVP